MSQYFYDYWLYTGNQTFLDKHTLLFTLESAAFYEDYLYPGRRRQIHGQSVVFLGNGAIQSSEQVERRRQTWWQTTDTL